MTTSEETTKSTIRKSGFTGKVVSDKIQFTRVVEVRSRKTHPKYKKIYTSSRRFHVHDAENSSKVGDTVTFVPSKPFSRTKKFQIIHQDKVS